MNKKSFINSSIKYKLLGVVLILTSILLICITVSYNVPEDRDCTASVLLFMMGVGLLFYKSVE